MIRLLSLVLLAVVSLSLPAHAGIAVTGGRLLAWCESDKPEEQALCQGYILSVGDILNDQTIYKGRACLPPTTSIEELQKLLVTFLHANEKHLQSASGANLAALAMIDVYPCSNS